MHSLNALNQKTFYLCDSGLFGVFSASVVEGNVEAPVFLGLPERGFVHGVSRVLTSTLDKCVWSFLLLFFNSCLVLEIIRVYGNEKKKIFMRELAGECEILMI